MCGTEDMLFEDIGVTAPKGRATKQSPRQPRPKKTRAASSGSPPDNTTRVATTGPSELPGFEKFWSAWPPSVRKVNKKKCAEKWKREKYEGIADRIVFAVETFKKTRQWTDRNGQFIPAPLVFLNQERWEAVEYAKSDSAEQAKGAGGAAWKPRDMTRAEIELLWGEEGLRNNGYIP
jgi:hypothetical protein